MDDQTSDQNVDGRCFHGLLWSRRLTYNPKPLDRIYGESTHVDVVGAERSLLGFLS